MRTLFLSALLLASPAFASHFIECDVEAKVVEVKSLARMDGVAVFGRFGVPNDHEQTVTVEITKIVNVAGRERSCVPMGSKHVLSVKAAQLGQYQVEQKLNLAYQNVGDARASRISWTAK